MGTQEDQIHKENQVHKENQIQALSHLMEIADRLNDTTYVPQLERMRQTLETPKLLVSVMGQFSAGKSKLLNQLLGRELLPAGYLETTAVITLIRYAQTERAVLVASDGSETTVDLKVARQLCQENAQKELENIQMLVLYVHADLLASGLVLADTPGLNTVITKHVQLAEKIMEASGMILYVMGKPVTDTDLQFLTEIKRAGQSVMLVRTHMDELKSTEEQADVSIRREQRRLQPFTDAPVFFVSSEAQSAFYSNIRNLESYIRTHLLSDIRQVAADVCAKRTAVIAAGYLSQIRTKEAVCRQYLDG